MTTEKLIILAMKLNAISGALLIVACLLALSGCADQQTAAMDAIGLGPISTIPLGVILW